MRKKTTLLAACLLLAAANAIAQPVWMLTFGGDDEDEGYSIQQTSDGGYIIAGRTQSFGAGNYDVYLIKTDSLGNTLWQRTFGGSGEDCVWSVQQTSDGGYITAGWTNSTGAGLFDVYVIKTDASGEPNWQRTFGRNLNDYGYCVQQTKDDGYIITGWTNSHSAGFHDVYLLKIDQFGNQLWQRTFGGYNEEYGYCVRQTSDYGYVITGFTRSFGAGGYDVFLIKTDITGHPIWQRTYGGSDDDNGHCVVQTSDGGYMIAGTTYSFGLGYRDVYLIKTDGYGTVLWQNSYGGNSGEGSNSVYQTTDEGFIIAGYTESYGVGPEDAFLLKTDVVGNQLWQRNFGGSSWDYFYDVQQTRDSGYILAGYTGSYGMGSWDVYLVKIDASAGFNSSTDSNEIPRVDWGSSGGTSLPLQQQQFSLLSAYPNPFNPTTTIRFDLPQPARVTLEVFDINGRCVSGSGTNRQWADINAPTTYGAGSHEITFDGSNLPSGVYLYRLEAGSITASGKMVLLK